MSEAVASFIYWATFCGQLKKRKKAIDLFGPIRENSSTSFGGIAQLGEHLICIQKVAGSIPVASTKFSFFRRLSKMLKKKKKDC